MNIFQWNIILISFLAFINSFIRQRNKNKIFVVVVTLIMLGISGLRHMSVGTDLIAYYRQFVSISYMNSLAEVFTSQKNFGYALLNMVFINIFGVKYQLFLFIIATISMISLGITIYRYSSAPYISFLLYMALGFYDFTFSGLKQTLALAFVLLSYKYICDRKPIKFTLMVALGATFHLSAFIFLPAYYIAHKKWSAGYACILILSYITMLVFRGQVAIFLAEMYKESGVSFSAEKFIGGKAIIILLLIVMGLVMNRTNINKDKNNMALFNIMLISFAIQTLSIYSHNFTRLNFYYFQFAILYVPKMIENYKASAPKLSSNRVSEKIIMKVVLIVLTILYYLRWINNEIAPHGILPYKMFWQ